MNGFHAILEFTGKLAHYSSEELIGLMTRAAQHAGATVLDSKIHEFGEGFGLTGVLLLAESHISVHTWPELNYAAFDVFMCGSTHVDNAIQVLTEEDPDGRHYVDVFERGPRKPMTNALSIAKGLLSEEPLLADRLKEQLSTDIIAVDIALAETLKFLALCSETRQQTLVPSLLIDTCWQNFVLFTRAYQSFCQQYLCRFVHYSPALAEDAAAEHYRFTRALLADKYAKLNVTVWPQTLQHSDVASGLNS